MSFFTKMNDKLSEGWKMTNINCKCKFNLLIQPQTKLLYCAKCEYQTTEPAEIRIEEDESDDVIVKPNESISEQDDAEFMKLNQEVKDMFNKPSKSDEYSKMLGQKLIQGWAMLEDSCPDCLIPIMKSRQGKRVCVGCEDKQQGSSEQLQKLEKVQKNDILPINNLQKDTTQNTQENLEIQNQEVKENKKEHKEAKNEKKQKQNKQDKNNNGSETKKDDKEIKNKQEKKIKNKKQKKPSSSSSSDEEKEIKIKTDIKQKTHNQYSDDKEIRNKQEKEIKRDKQKKSSSSSSSSSDEEKEIKIKTDIKQKTHKSYSDVFQNLQENSLKYANSIGTVLDYYKKKLLEATNDNDSKLVKKFAGKLSKISDANLKFYDKIKKLSK